MEHPKLNPNSDVFFNGSKLVIGELRSINHLGKGIYELAFSQDNPNHYLGHLKDRMAGKKLMLLFEGEEKWLLIKSVRETSARNHGQEWLLTCSPCEPDYTPQNPTQKERTMSKIENIAIIANDNLTTVKAAFSWANSNDKTYTFKAERTFASTLKADDYIVVDSKNGLSIARVVSVDEFADVEPESDVDYRWAFAKVDRSELDRLIKSEADIVRQLKTAQRENIKSAALRGLGITDGALQIGTSADKTV